MSHTVAKKVVERKHFARKRNEPRNFPTDDELRKFVDGINKEYKSKLKGE